MFLKGKYVSIRALEPSDAQLLYTWENNRSLWSVSFTQLPFSKFILDEFVNMAHHDLYTNKQTRFIILNTNSHEPIGIIDLFDFEPQHARIGLGIFIHESFRRNGFALETIQLIKSYCFETLLLKQVYVHISESNTASIDLFEKCGFQKSGLKKSWHKTGLNTYENVWFMQFVQEGD